MKTNAIFVNLIILLVVAKCTALNILKLEKKEKLITVLNTKTLKNMELVTCLMIILSAFNVMRGML